VGDPPAFPWLYPYQEDEGRSDVVVLRPVVPISLVADEPSPPVAALVDSGSEHVLAAPWLAQAVGIDLDASTKFLQLGIGGHTVTTRFADLALRLHPPGDHAPSLRLRLSMGTLSQRTIEVMASTPDVRACVMSCSLSARPTPRFWQSLTTARSELRHTLPTIEPTNGSRSSTHVF
jgi:hypothetical protein